MVISETIKCLDACLDGQVDIIARLTEAVQEKNLNKIASLLGSLNFYQKSIDGYREELREFAEVNSLI